MKKCPTCNRTYADETLTYCLADGSLLSAPYDPEATQRIYPSRITNSPPTEVLPSNLPPSQPLPQSRNSILTYVVIGLLALIAGGGIVAWLKSESKDVPPTNSSTKAASASPTESPKATPKQPKTQTVKVDAQKMWIDTGIVLGEGEKLIMQASGQWANSTPHTPYGPNGLNNTWPGTILESANNGSLIGKVNGVVFPVGANYSGYSPASGKLYLSMNDVPSTYSDNFGAVSVRISYGGD